MTISIDSTLEYVFDAAKESMEGSDSGSLYPSMTAVDGDGSMLNLILPGEQHPSDYIRPVTAIITTRQTMRYIIFVSEAWMKQFPVGGEGPKLERGELARMHEEGDASVVTIMVVSVFDIEADKVVTHNAKLLSALGTKPIEWGPLEEVRTGTREDAYGNVETSFFEGIDIARRVIAENGPAPEGTLETYLKVLAKVGLIAGGFAAMSTPVTDGEGADDE